MKRTTAIAGILPWKLGSCLFVTIFDLLFVERYGDILLQLQLPPNLHGSDGKSCTRAAATPCTSNAVANICIYIFFRDFSLGEADFVPWVSFGHSGRSFSLAIRGILEPSMAVAVARSESVHNQFPRQWDKARPLYGGGGPANCTLAIPAFEKGI